ncbi:hypothetical protein P1J78_16790 [Psychromarinibacter sp. C21-152]|uniref:Uncharacterized protein n=1 Tax=Psychromarinibacter sediminicola TaxID=3033385 RepID=A0AAE3NRX0_9RHOB|nr:hypothetical protein [Psychromarinibacter sediminicola]MDF0602398.1 hypothetical protein [Psychromarinibacter sediminicola]
MTRRIHTADRSYEDSIVLALMAMDDIPRDLRDTRHRPNRSYGYVDLPPMARRGR